MKGIKNDQKQQIEQKKYEKEHEESELKKLYARLPVDPVLQKNFVSVLRKTLDD